MDIFLRNKLKYQINFGPNRVKGAAKRPLSIVSRIMAGLAFILCVVFSSLTHAIAANLTVKSSHLIISAAITSATNTIGPFNMDLSDNNAVLTPAEKHVTCYPNPAVSYINFKFDKSVPKDASLYVFSFTGKKMTEQALTGAVIKITLDNYYRGLYVYQLRSAGGAILESGKFQVKN